MDIIHDSVDLMRLTFLSGALLALLYKKKVGVTPGGIVVPGILTLLLFTDIVVFLITIASALACFLIYEFTLGGRALERKWSSIAMVSISCSIGLTGLYLLDDVYPITQETSLLTMVAPGLIAISIRKYSINSVIKGMSIVTAATTFIGLLLLKSIPIKSATELSVGLSIYPELSLSNPYLVIPASLVAAALVLKSTGTKGGGYLIMPFLAAITWSSPLQLTGVIICTMLSVVTIRLIQSVTLITGLERFVLSLWISGIAITCLDLLATKYTIPGYKASDLIVLISVAVITNELTLQSLKRTYRSYGVTSIAAQAARLAS